MSMYSYWAPLISPDKDYGADDLKICVQCGKPIDNVHDLLAYGIDNMCVVCLTSAMDY